MNRNELLFDASQTSSNHAFHKRKQRLLGLMEESMHNHWLPWDANGTHLMWPIMGTVFYLPSVVLALYPRIVLPNRFLMSLYHLRWIKLTVQAQPQTAFTPHLNKHSSMFSKGNAFGLNDPEPLESQDQAAPIGTNPSGSNLNSSNVPDPLQ